MMYRYGGRTVRRDVTNVAAAASRPNICGPAAGGAVGRCELQTRQRWSIEFEAT